MVGQSLGHYRILEKLGEVYVAEDTRLGRRVALKLLRLEASPSPERRHHQVTSDGQRFVMIEEGEPPPAPTQSILVQNWGEERKRLVPAN